jgi:hypothetical protein
MSAMRTPQAFAALSLRSARKPPCFEIRLLDFALLVCGQVCGNVSARKPARCA